MDQVGNDSNGFGLSSQRIELLFTKMRKITEGTGLEDTGYIMSEDLNILGF